MHRVKTHKILESEEDRRIFNKSTDGLGRIFFYHCPVEHCMKREVKFQGMRNLKQHYIRVHTEKTLSCECGSKFSLRKDYVYHKKVRCLSRQLEPDKSSSPRPAYRKPSKLKNDKKNASSMDNTFMINRSKEFNNITSTNQPIVVIVPTDNVQDTIEKIASTLRSTCEVAVQAQTATFLPQTSTVGVGNDLPQSFDFSGQFNSIQPNVATTSYFCPHSNTPDVRHISTGTDFTFTEAQFMNFDNQGNNQFSAFEFASHATNHRPNPELHYAHFQPSGETVETRSFGTIIDESLLNGVDSPSIRHAATGMEHSLAFLRDIETQTYCQGLEGNRFWNMDNDNN